MPVINVHRIMAPVALERRANGCPSGTYYGGDGFCYRSNWHWWGRWVLAGIVVIVFILLLLVLCMRRRRMRKQGRTNGAWVGGWGSQPPQNYPPQNYPPPQYTQQPQFTGGTYDSNQGYYGHNTGSYGNNDVPLQQPGNTYAPNRGVDASNDYAPPAGPPPGKK